MTNAVKYKFKIGDKIRHIEEGCEGNISGLTTLGEVLDGDCEDDQMNQPWYIVEWEDFDGQEPEDGLELDPCPIHSVGYTHN